MALHARSEDADFLAPRDCFKPLDPALEQAADLLSEAADALVAGDMATARARLQEADIADLWAHANGLMNKMTADVLRYRRVSGAPETLAPEARPKLRRLPPATEMAVFTRDGFRCRYCGCRVVLARARRIMRALAPDALRWGCKDAEQHSAFYALTAVSDHVVPHARGGETDPDNLVTTCQGCNYGKVNHLLEELGLMDPRVRPPVCDHWDGLSRMLSVPVPAVAEGASSGRRATTEKKGQMAAGALRRVKAKPPAEWYAGIERSNGRQAERLLAYLPSVAHLNVSWRVGKCLLVDVTVGDAKMAVLGIEQDGTVQIPWLIGDQKARFKRFADILASAIPGAKVYETPRMWRVNKGGRMVLLSELMDASAELTSALGALNLAGAD